jgi:hypothetical protein
MGKACSAHGGKRNSYRILVGKSDETKPLRKTRRRWDDNIKTGLREME